jgi:hypothetical protein
VTEIRDIEIPPVDRESRRTEPGRSGISVLVLLCISAVVMTAMNLTATVYLYRASTDTKAVVSRLEQLSAFEGRVLDKLNLMNNGVQSQFDRQNSDLQGKFSEAYGRIDRMEAAMKNFRVGSAAWNHVTGAGEAASEAPPLKASLPEFDQTSGDDPIAAIESPAPSRPAGNSAPAPSAAYQRLESADGKIYYRKIR